MSCNCHLRFFSPYFLCSEANLLSVDEDEAVLHRKMPRRTFTGREKRSVPGFKASGDRPTHLLGANAAGDLKSQPVFIYPLKIL